MMYHSKGLKLSIIRKTILFNLRNNYFIELKINVIQSFYKISSSQFSIYQISYIYSQPFANKYLQANSFVKEQLKGVKVKQTKIEKHDFMKTLKMIEDQLLQSIKIDKKASCGEIQLKKTNREVELKQQKQIIQLQQKLSQAQKDCQDLKEQNHQIYTEMKKQKQIIKSLEREKQQYSKDKVIWDKKLQNQEELYSTNLRMTDDVKKVLNMINEDIDREAVVKAKKMK
ncbi:unnamed protein product [Paramecium pentaurelia]|uniref:Uncharacterized protein n=1 Tax=Paramecium pentaurelia TaxID=43138 RepID=A0A8S1UIA8_9CILI|nr:unnamed protein product [Paramecium pentaurelia]